MKKNDVIVIGGGMAGLFAAITAARRGRQVLLITKGVGAIAIGGGTIDLLGYDAKGVPVASPQTSLAGLAADHPYTLVGADGVTEAMESFLSLCAEAGYPYIGSPKQNRWIPTALGTVKPSCLVPRTMDAADLKTTEEVFVASFAGLKDYCAKAIADALIQYPGYRKKYSVISLQTDLMDGRDLTALDVARWLDLPQGRQRCIDQLRSSVGPRNVILLPPVLGTRPDYTALDEIAQATQCRLIETVGLPPAVTGFRLRRLLLQYLSRFNIRLVEQAGVVRATMKDGRCQEIVTGNLDRERTYRAESYILASGGFFGGGLQAGPSWVRETVFNLPVSAPAQQTDWSKEKLFFSGSQPFARFGVKVDERLQPLDETGRVLLKNVFVAGRTLAGYDYCSEKSGNGVALATAYRAGLEA